MNIQLGVIYADMVDFHRPGHICEMIVVNEDELCTSPAQECNPKVLFGIVLSFFEGIGLFDS